MKDGGPAFPVVGMQHINGQAVTGIFQSGMSLRDYFAAVALPELQKRSNFQVFHTAEMHAKDAYAQADAMLAEREKNGTT